MGQDKKQLTKLLAFVKELYDHPDNKEFADGLNAIVLNRLAITTNQDIKKVKEAIEIAGLSPDSPIYHARAKDLREEMMNEVIRTNGFENKWTIWFCELAENTNISDSALFNAMICAITMPIVEMEEDEDE